jgi:hypothetical protein
MIEIDLIIKDNNTKDILDTTLENIAKESNILTQNNLQAINCYLWKR